MRMEFRSQNLFKPKVSEKLQHQKDLITEELKNILQELQQDFLSNSNLDLGTKSLFESLSYSLLGDGKRFRPLLCLNIAEVFGIHPKKVVSFACAVEMIHTYSLIHDDLPCMDNDDERRGKPTNHIVFGEAIALLAGDTLLTECFGVIAKKYKESPIVALNLIKLLVEASGFSGMISGQSLDIHSKIEKISLDFMQQMHRLKTAALIRVCCEGTAVICGLPKDKQQLLREYGELLGFAFQLKDDLLDSSEKIEPGSFPDRIGIEGTEKKLNEIVALANEVLLKMNLEKSYLKDLIEFNQKRQH